MLSRKFIIVNNKKVVRSVTRSCVICRKHSVKPSPQLLGQLPLERVTPDNVFSRVGVDYAGPIYGHVRKPTVIKGYVCVFVSLSVKAVHLEHLSSDAFIACLRRFVARRGLPDIIWSDHGTNFVGANREMKERNQFLDSQKNHNIEWKYIPEHAPHFGGIWEAAVKSFKKHLKKVVGNVKLDFEEMTTTLTQIEACLNSRPLSPLPFDEDGTQALTPGHFLIGRPLTSLPDPAYSYRPMSLLRRWHLCQQVVRHFWYSEYLVNINRYSKWNKRSRIVCVGDLVILREDGLVPGKWLLARVACVHPGQDGLVRVVTVKTSNGSYKRPVSKVAVL